jgi:hypothetical protein
MWYNRMLPVRNRLGQVILYQESWSKCYDLCQLILAQTLSPRQPYMVLFGFLALRGYGQNHVSGRSFETYGLLGLPVNINQGERRPG